MNTPTHIDAEIENFGYLHLEYRYGYHLIDSHKKRSIWSIWDDPQIVFFQFYRGRDVKTPTNYIYLDSTQ